MKDTKIALILFALIAASIIGVFILATSSVVYMCTKRGKTEAYITMIELACENFEQRYGIFPPETNWVDELIRSSNAVIHTNNFSFINSRKFNDGWGNAFVYKSPGKMNTNSFDVYSLGADGISESEGNDRDDINNWDNERTWEKHYNPSKLLPGMLFFAVIIILLIIGWINIKKPESPA